MEDFSYLSPEASLSPKHCNGTKASKISEEALRTSVSFGRFLSQSLDWGKWSTFCQKKYMEEIETCFTPGSVAQKKAFFEAKLPKSMPSKSFSFLEQENVGESENNNIVNHALKVHNLKQTGNFGTALIEKKKSSFSSLNSSTNIKPDPKGEISHKSSAVEKVLQELKASKTTRKENGLPKHGSIILHSSEQGSYSNYSDIRRNQSKARTALSSSRSKASGKAEKLSKEWKRHQLQEIPKASQMRIRYNMEGRKSCSEANSCSNDLPPLQPSITPRLLFEWMKIA